MHIRSGFPQLADKYPLRWLSLKLMDGDEHVRKEINFSGEGAFIADSTAHLKRAHGEDIESIMADKRYALASGLSHEALKKPEFRKMEITERIDKIVLNRSLGIPIFLAAMWVVFKLTFDFSAPFADWIDAMTTGMG